ncbi:DUF2975 domain-containing protein [Salipaludibacillus sp. HK11]|uniref:DUF2975 domain-containing protein n=1 Tax=Salipaludibacillus sp. HK11 TaxID=3394320 RepID=UPI0039FD5179
MKPGSTLFLKIAVILIGITILSLCIFWLPWIASVSTEAAPEFAYLQYPVLIGLYVTSIPFFFALYQALKLLDCIKNNATFSELSVKGLMNIKYCAIVISILYVLGSLFLLLQNALHPGIAIIGMTITFASVVIAVFTAVLQRLLENAITIKSENDLTV